MIKWGDRLMRRKDREVTDMEGGRKTTSQSIPANKNL